MPTGVLRADGGPARAYPRRVVIYEGCTTRIVFEDGSPPYVDEDTEVRIEGGRLLVFYFDDEGAVVYDGVEEEPGRFRLMARSRRRTGMVCFDDSGTVLRGHFEEDGERFRFEIRLTRS